MAVMWKSPFASPRFSWPGDFLCRANFLFLAGVIFGLTCMVPPSVGAENVGGGDASGDVGGGGSSGGGGGPSQDPSGNPGGKANESAPASASGDRGSGGSGGSGASAEANVGRAGDSSSGTSGFEGGFAGLESSADRVRHLVGQRQKLAAICATGKTVVLIDDYIACR